MAAVGVARAPFVSVGGDEEDYGRKNCTLGSGLVLR